MYRLISPLIKDILRFFCNPYSFIYSAKSEPFSERILVGRNALIVCLFASFYVVFFISFFVEPFINYKFNISIATNRVSNMTQFKESYSFIRAYTMITLLGPFEEEVLFRLILITRSWLLRLVIFFGWVSYFIPDHLNPSYFSVPYFTSILVVVMALLFGERQTSDSFPIKFGKHAYNALCWLSMVAFSAIHIGNFAPLNWSIFYLYSIYVLPQFVYGMVFSYLTIRYNSLLWPVFLHMTINTIASLPWVIKHIFH